MKKLIAIGLLSALFAGLSAFGQGYTFFSGFKSTVWDGFTTPNISQRTSNVNVAFLWGPNAAVPLVDSIMAGTPTNFAALGAGLSYDTAWNDILNDPNFTLGFDNNSSTLAMTHTISSFGSFNYNSDFPVTGTTAATTYTLFVIGWDANFSSPQLAAAAGSVVGWSQPFTHTLVTQIDVPNTMHFSPFGVLLVPEPSAVALSGLAGLSLLLFCRRK